MCSKKKLYFERWRVSLVVEDSAVLSPPSAAGSSPSVEHALELGRARELEAARDGVQARMLQILETVSHPSAIDHVPGSLYQYEIEVAGSIVSGGAGTGAGAADAVSPVRPRSINIRLCFYCSSYLFYLFSVC